ncbi:MAG: hypothetical protein ABEL76_17160 [Bradymonadaceae bacterium]
MEPFTPDDLIEVRVEVARDHPDSKTALREGRLDDSSRLAEQIVEKLRAWDETNTGEVVESLTSTECEYLTSVCVHLEGDELRAAAACLERLDLELPFAHAWQIANDHFFDETGALVLQCAEKAPSGYASSVVETYLDESPTEAVRTALQLAHEWSLSAERAKEELRVVEGSSFARSFDESLLVRAPAEFLLAQPREYLVETFDRARLDIQVRGLRNLHREFHGVSDSEVIGHGQIRGMLKVAYEERALLLDELRDKDRRASEWVESLLNLVEFDEFFAEDHERFEFWRHYADTVEDLDADTSAGRLFLDFGGFGVVEFRETGFATYIYEPEDFREIRAMSSSRSNRSFQDRDRAIDRLVHHSGWQERFHRQIRELLQEQSRPDSASDRRARRDSETGSDDNDLVDDPEEAREAIVSLLTHAAFQNASEAEIRTGAAEKGLPPAFVLQVWNNATNASRAGFGESFDRLHSELVHGD